MGHILIHPDDSAESIAEIAKLSLTGIYGFDLTPISARLRPLCFNSRASKMYENNYHLFVGRVIYGRWVDTIFRRYQWGILFYLTCNCSAVKEILYYQGKSNT